MTDRHDREKQHQQQQQQQAVVRSKPKELDGYVGFANLPNQVYRKAVKKGFDFTLMVVGKLNFFCNFFYVALLNLFDY